MTGSPSAGYRALAPDLYHRVAGARTLPETDDGRDRGFQLLADLTLSQILDDVEVATAHATSDGIPLAGLVGLSVGGYLAFRVATAMPVPAAVLLYPGWLDTPDNPLRDGTTALDDLDNVNARLLILAGQDDHVLTAPTRDRIAAAFATSRNRHEAVQLPRRRPRLPRRPPSRPRLSRSS